MLVFIHDSTYAERLDWDFDSIAGVQFLAVPHFEKHVMISDTRHVERVIWNETDTPEYAGDSMLIRGERYGKKMSFSVFCKKVDVNLDKFNPPDLPVIGSALLSSFD